eukprot:scaffold288725_cov18-Tisochrysis_lutea.AAC.1
MRAMVVVSVAGLQRGSDPNRNTRVLLQRQLLLLQHIQGGGRAGACAAGHAKGGHRCWRWRCQAAAHAAVYVGPAVHAIMLLTTVVHPTSHYNDVSRPCCTRYGSRRGASSFFTTVMHLGFSCACHGTPDCGDA